MAAIGLYYPYVHFRDRAWVKAAALYMPHLARIVPRGFRVSDSYEVRALNDAFDFVQDFLPGSAVDAASATFLRLLRTHESALRARYALEDRTASVNAEPASPTQTVRFAPGHESLSRWAVPVAGVFHREMSVELREALVSTGLGSTTRRNSLEEHEHAGVWVGLHPRVAWVYKCALTAEMASATAFLPMTDQEEAHNAAGGWTTLRMAEALLGDQERGEPHEDLLSLVAVAALRTVLPAGLGSVPVKKIITLREKHGAEFHAFTEAVEETARSLREQTQGITNVRALELHLDTAVRKQFETRLAELQAAVRAQGLGTVVSAVSLRAEVPALVTAGSGLVASNGAVTTIGTSSAFALGALGLLTTRKRERAELVAGDRAASFLLRTKTGLRPDTLVRRVLVSARGLRPGR